MVKSKAKSLYYSHTNVGPSSVASAQHDEEQGTPTPASSPRATRPTNPERIPSRGASSVSVGAWESDFDDAAHTDDTGGWC